jgi:hypothetical protein
MKELFMLVRETVWRSFEIATFRSVGPDLPQAKGFATVLAVLSAAFVAGEQLARGHGIVGMLIAPPAWLFVVWTASRAGRKTDYRLASALFLGSIPVCAALIMVAGVKLLEWAVAAWGAFVIVNVLMRKQEGWSPWR